MFHVNADNAFPIACAAGSRRAARPAWPAAVTTAPSPTASGIRSASRSTATRSPIRSIPTSSSAARSHARIAAPVRSKTSARSRFARAATALVRTAPVVFSQADPHALFFASNTVWKTTNGGESWTEISPDLTRKTWTVPESARGYVNTPQTKVTQRGVVYALAPSPLDINTLWAGTDDGLIHVTRDGGKDMDRRHAAGAQTVGEGLDPRGVALGCERSVRGHQHDPPRRAAPSHLPDARRRQDVAAHRQRHCRRRDDQRRPRRSETSRAALRGQRDAGVGLVR